MKLNAFIAGAGLAFMAATAANAAVVYDNGAPNQASGNEMTNWVQSEDFTLTTGATVTGVHFWSVDQGRLSDGSLSWFIYADAAGMPGSVIASGNTNLVTRTATGNALFFGTEFSNEFSIGALALAAGTYHLGLHNGLLSRDSRDEFYWETTAGNGTGTGLEDQTPFGDNEWFNNSQEHAFFLIGNAVAVPEPGTLGLLGLAAFALALRRKQA